MEGGLRGSSVTGQHPPLYGGKGVPIPAPCCNLREHKHGLKARKKQKQGEMLKGKLQYVAIEIKYSTLFVRLLIEIWTQVVQKILLN